MTGQLTGFVHCDECKRQFTREEVMSWWETATREVHICPNCTDSPLLTAKRLYDESDRAAPGDDDYIPPIITGWYHDNEC